MGTATWLLMSQRRQELPLLLRGRPSQVSTAARQLPTGWLPPQLLPLPLPLLQKLDQLQRQQPQELVLLLLWRRLAGV
jgi:hypothetical protein